VIFAFNPGPAAVRSGTATELVFAVWESTIGYVPATRTIGVRESSEPPGCEQPADCDQQVDERNELPHGVLSSVGSREAAGPENLLLGDGEIDEGGEISPSPAVDEAHEVTEQRGIRPLPALVGGGAGELEQLVDLRLREVERGRVLAASRSQPIARVS
jgi:hypothetical protein